MPEPAIARRTRTQGMLITGVGGTGVVTVGAILAMAAHLDGHGVGVIDMAGLAQKGGAVTSHVRIGPTPDAINAIRVAADEADTILACDMVVAGARKSLAAIPPGERASSSTRTRPIPATSPASADMTLPTRRLRRAIADRAGAGARALRRGGADRDRARRRRDRHEHVHGRPRLAAGRAADQPASILEAIRLNGVEVEMNQAAFEWGRRAAFDLAAAERAAGVSAAECRARRSPMLVARRVEFLTGLSERRLRRPLSRAGRRIAAARSASRPAAPRSRSKSRTRSSS